MGDFARDADGKISRTKLSSYGKKQLRLIQGEQVIHFSDIGWVGIKGNKMIIQKTGKVLDTIDSDFKVNKVHFRLILG